MNKFKVGDYLVPDIDKIKILYNGGSLVWTKNGLIKIKKLEVDNYRIAHIEKIPGGYNDFYRSEFIDNNFIKLNNKLIDLLYDNI